jgi:hypothetical protein
MQTLGGKFQGLRQLGPKWRKPGQTLHWEGNRSTAIAMAFLADPDATDLPRAT